MEIIKYYNGNVYVVMQRTNSVGVWTYQGNLRTTANGHPYGYRRPRYEWRWLI